MARSESGRMRSVRMLIGLLAVGAGAALTLRPFESLDALTLFIGASLIIAGIGEILGDDASDRLIDRLTGPVLLLTGMVALLLRGETLKIVALAIGAGLALFGATRLVTGLRGRDGERYSSIVGGGASLLFGLLSLLWPDVTILVLALLVGPVAVILGIGQLLRAIVGRQFPARRRAGTGPSFLVRSLHVVQATISLVVVLVLVGVSFFLHRGSPTLGAFYDSPADLPDAPGQLLRDEAFSRNMPDNTTTRRVLYTTTGADGGITTASALVILPATSGDRPLDVILWEHGTTGVARKCAPSNLDDPLGAGAMPASQLAIDHGWAIVAPDYLGLGGAGEHPYLVGIPTAQSSLDAVRAARQLDGVNLSEKTVVWGHSQGGGAALWVGVQAASYAPDVPLLGVVAMAPASDLPAMASTLANNPGGKLFTAFILKGYSESYDDVSWNDYILPAASEVMGEAVERCLAEPSTLISVAAILSGEIFQTSPSEGALGQRLRENVPAAMTGIPTFIAQGLSDDLVDPAAQTAFVDTLCTAGQIVEYGTYEGRDHLSVVADDSPLIDDLIAWTSARFAGASSVSSCRSFTR